MSLQIDKVTKGNIVFHKHTGEDVRGGNVGGIVPVNTIQLDVLYTPTGSEPIGSIYWHETDGTFNLVLKNGTILQSGQEIHFYGKASGAIANGDPCQFAGVQGDHILVKKAVAAEIDANPEYFIGVATQNIANGDFGYITWFGKINGVYTKTPANNDAADWVNGDLLYLNMTTGYLTKTEPTAPTRRIVVAAVVKIQTGSSENGIIIVRPTLGMKLGDLDDVDGSAPDATGDLLTWNQSTLTWERNAYNITSYSQFLVNTEAVILGTSAAAKQIAYGTDTQFFYIADGTDWRRASLKFYTDSANPDIGLMQNNSKDGYYATFITDKYLYNVILQGYTGTPVNGAIRINTDSNPDTFEIYMRDTGWFTIIYDLSMTLGYFVHYPFSSTQAVKVWSGMSNEVGLNGRPMINEYDISPGPYPPPKVINCGSF